VIIDLKGDTLGLRPNQVVLNHQDTDFKIDVSRWKNSVLKVLPSDSDRILSFVTIEIPTS
jgi:hypothetical protein